MGREMMSMSFPFLFYNASDMKNLFSAILFFTIIAPICEAATTDVVYKDKSVIEVFANGGQCVMTALVFPSESATNASVFTLEGKTHADITVFPIRTIWEKKSAAR